MKKILTRSLFLTVILLALNFVIVYGSTKSGDYKYDVLSNGDIAIVSYSGTAATVTVPSTLDGKKVIKLNAKTFDNNSKVKTITLSEGIKAIEMYAFNNCSELTTINFPESIKSICKDFVYNCPKAKYKIPANLTKLVDYNQTIYQEVVTVTTVGNCNYDYANEVLKLVNEERAKVNLKPLKLNMELTEYAMKRAAETAIYWDHERANALSCFSVYDLVDGENIAAGQSTPASVMKGWMNSPGHRAQILKESYKSIGIGCYKVGTATYWVQLFSKTSLSSGSKTGTKENVENKVQVATDGVSFLAKSVHSIMDERIEFTVEGFSDEMKLNIGDTLAPTKVKFLNQELLSKKYVYDETTGQYNSYTIRVGTPIAPTDITWKSSNEKVFKVAKDGTITVVGGGKAVLTATLGNYSLTYDIVVDSPLISIELPKTAVVYEGYTSTLVLTYNPENTTDNKDVVYSSEDPSIAYVDDKGILHGEKVGTTVITAKVGNKIANCVVSVEEAVLESISFTKTEETVLVSENTKVLDIVFTQGMDTIDDTIIWTTSDSTVAQVSSEGVVRVLSKGKVTITATTSSGNVATCELNIVDFKMGDLNKDGSVNADDAAIALDLYKYHNTTVEDLLIGDMDGDGHINADDAVAILDIYKTNGNKN